MATKLYLGKTKDILKEELKILVTKYGLVKNFEDKESYCFVDYYYESDARIAQVELDGQILNGCKLVAQFSKTSIKQDDISKEALPSQAKRVYVGNLNYKFSHNELHLIFSRFGQVNELINKDTYALVVNLNIIQAKQEYSNQQSATQAILHMNETNLKGETLRVDMQKSYDEVLCNTNRIFVGKLGSQITKQDLILNFGQFGFIEDVTLKDDQYGFIQFKNILQASKAIKEMNGATIKDSKIQVQEARSKGGQNHNQNNHQNHPMMNLLPHQVPYTPVKQTNHNNDGFKNQQGPQVQKNIFHSFLPDLRLKTDARSRSRSREKLFQI